MRLVVEAREQDPELSLNAAVVCDPVQLYRVPIR